MSSPALEEYLTGAPPEAAPSLRALERAVLTAHPDFDVAVKYRIVLYAIEQDWRGWVCAIDGNAKRVGVRFLFGVLLDDPRGVLRPGSSTLMTWDFAVGAEIDAEGVGAYVREAVAKYPDYKVRGREITEAARAAAAGRRRGHGEARPRR